MLRVLHLADAAAPEDSAPWREFLTGEPGLAAMARHEVALVPHHRPWSPRMAEADVVVSHLPLSWRGLPGLVGLRARAARLRLIHVEHRYCEGYVASRVTARQRFRALLRTGYALFDEVAAVSPAQAAWMQRHALTSGPPPRVVPPCALLEALPDLPRPRLPPQVIGAIGRFDRQSGFDLLVEAFRALPATPGAPRLQLIGAGPMEAALRRAAAGDARIGIAAMPAGGVPAALAACDAVAIPSRWDPFGLLAVQAMAAGRPVLVAPVDGLPEHVADGAVRVPVMTAAAWSQALSGLAADARHPPSPHLKARQAAARSVSAWSALLASAEPARRSTG
ncbi:glycosyltransferase family 4 protein [Mangrovicoccus algicola]|uniref:Glycosyltransferase family 4 protein n=1 Tax=Mangrovicoccus algicola TaxID=2771008 RepID=A0A8J6Z2U6_9RHOB|nr:glycosyltransferase family 4 protein [Mangrovicoccus algicola]MBE3640688.1 glycosyltransferase family 4 protein [Mangrovicoccus algicola]